MGKKGLTMDERILRHLEVERHISTVNACSGLAISAHIAANEERTGRLLRASERLLIMVEGAKSYAKPADFVRRLQESGRADDLDSVIAEFSENEREGPVQPRRLDERTQRLVDAAKALRDEQANDSSEEELSDAGWRCWLRNSHNGSVVDRILAEFDDPQPTEDATTELSKIRSELGVLVMRLAKMEEA